MYEPRKIITYATGSYAAEWVGRVANQFSYPGGHLMTPRVNVENDAYGSTVYPLPFGLPPLVELDRATGLPVQDRNGQCVPVTATGVVGAAQPVFG